MNACVMGACAVSWSVHSHYNLLLLTVPVSSHR